MKTFNKIDEVINRLKKAQNELRGIRELNMPDYIDAEIQNIVTKIEKLINITLT